MKTNEPDTQKRSHDAETDLLARFSAEEHIIADCRRLLEHVGDPEDRFELRQIAQRAVAEVAADGV